MKRKFDDIRQNILKQLSKKPMNRMELAKATNCDYRTIERQVVWLIGEGKIKKYTKDNKIVFSKQ